jgi:2-keto-4-pentenoate hydratase/2-oxohepta-3-ene-1,7-dioic acid hydratase in catechol pathway
MTLNAGDVLLTGTPEGPVPLKHGDILEGTLSLNGEMI